ncbi:MAG: CcmD family protein [Isosphaerales bacterium]
MSRTCSASWNVQPILDGLSFESVEPGPEKTLGPPGIWEGAAMGTFIATYAIVWLALVLYIVRLRTNQRRLEQLARTLESRVQNLRAWAETGSQANLGA